MEVKISLKKNKNFDDVIYIIKNSFKKVDGKPSDSLTVQDYKKYLEENNLDSIAIYMDNKIIGYSEVGENLIKGIVLLPSYRKSEIFDRVFKKIINFLKQNEYVKITVPGTCRTKRRRFNLRKEKDLTELKNTLKLLTKIYPKG